MSLKSFGSLSVTFSGHRQLRRRFGELAVGKLLAAGPDDEALLRAHVGELHLPLVRRGLHEHRARLRAHGAQLVVRIPHARGAARHLHAEHRVGVLGRRRARAPRAPCVQSHSSSSATHHRQRRGHALAELEVLHHHGDRCRPCRCAGTRWAGSASAARPARTRGARPAGSQKEITRPPPSGGGGLEEFAAGDLLRPWRRLTLSCSDARGALDRLAHALVGAAAADVAAHRRVDVRVRSATVFFCSSAIADITWPDWQ